MALAVAFYAAFQGSKPAFPAKLKPFANFSAGSVNKISIRRADQGTLDLEKLQNRWWLIQPLTVAANLTKVRSLLRLLESTADSSIDAKAIEPGQFGLQTPAVVILFDGHEVALGDSNALTGKRYLLYEGRVYAVADTVYHDALADPASFASVNLLDTDESPTALHFKGITLQRNGAKWTMVPASAGVTGDKIAGYADAWRHAQAYAVKRAEQAAAKANFESAFLEFADRPKIEFIIRSRQPELILERRDLGLEYHFFPENLDRLLPSIANANVTPAATLAPSTTTERGSQ